MESGNGTESKVRLVWSGFIDSKLMNNFKAAQRQGKKRIFKIRLFQSVNPDMEQSLGFQVCYRESPDATAAQSKATLFLLHHFRPCQRLSTVFDLSPLPPTSEEIKKQQQEARPSTVVTLPVVYLRVQFEDSADSTDSGHHLKSASGRSAPSLATNRKELDGVEE